MVEQHILKIVDSFDKMVLNNSLKDIKRVLELLNIKYGVKK